MSPTKKIVLLTGGGSGLATAKTAINLIRYRTDEIVAVWDPLHQGKVVRDILGFGGTIPIVGSLAGVPTVDTLMVGIAPSGGRLPPPMRQVVLEGLQRGLSVVSGLHEFLGDDPELSAIAQQQNAEIRDVRRNRECDVATGRGAETKCLRIHTVGNDCNVGKMVVSLEVARALRRDGHDAKFVATGQTGIMIEGDGCPIDAVVSDFVNGAAEKLVLANADREILLIEGQGSLSHPRFSAVTLGLLHGCSPHGLIFCYEMGRSTVSGMDHVPIPSLARLKAVYESMANLIHPCRVIGFGINSRHFSAREADEERARVQDEFQLPACDVLRHGPTDLVNAVSKCARELSTK